MVKLFDYQRDAVNKLKTGSILCGGVGSGKSLTSLVYYFENVCGGKIDHSRYSKMRTPKPLYIITTARKRDQMEWEKELLPFLLPSEENSVVVDSWNNIKKYISVESAFFIFDEQRVVGYGEWTKSFLKITKKNDWILLSATPGDSWSDYIPVFIANGFYRNKTEFTNRHVVYSRFTKFPKIDKYVDTKRLEKMRDYILVNMDYETASEQIHTDVIVQYDREKYKRIMNRWNIYEDAPITNASELCYLLRRVVNEDGSREDEVKALLMTHKKSIIFYNFDYELEILRELMESLHYPYSEWNGHKHEPIPSNDHWVYLVQYTAGAEGWNCIETDTIIFYSQNYSYKIMIQSAGRIDRLNTPFKKLYYFHLRSYSPIDLAINRSLKRKKKFNESKFVGTFINEGSSNVKLQSSRETA